MRNIARNLAHSVLYSAFAVPALILAFQVNETFSNEDSIHHRAAEHIDNWEERNMPSRGRQEEPSDLVVDP